MNASALIFGSIGTLAETSELQRRAFNRAFAEFDLDWVWDKRSYRRLLRRPGGIARIVRYAEDAGDRVDAKAVHAAKTRIFARLLRIHGARPRPGVREMIAAARRRGLPVVLATTTGADQVRAVLDALSPAITPDAFHWIGDAAHAARPKPASDIFHMALARLDRAAADVVAIEDTAVSASAALGAGLRVLGFPGAFARGADFPSGMLVVDRLQPRLLDLDHSTVVAAAE